jgi:hypothetical protein
MIKMHKGITKNRRKVLTGNRGLRNRKRTRVAARAKNGMIISHAMMEWGNRKGSDAINVPNIKTTTRDE